MSDMILNVSTLSNLFEILKSKNSYADNTDSRLSIVEKKKEQIIKYIKELESSSDASSIINQENISAARNAITNLDIISLNLNNLKSNLEIIEENILKLVLKKEDASYPEKDLNEDIQKIKEEINEFNELSNRLDVDIQEKYKVVKHFFNSTLSFKLESSKEDDEIFEKANIKTKIYEVPENVEQHKDINQSNTASSTKTTKIKKIETESYEADNKLTNLANSLGVEDNLVLRISEKENKVYLPYTKEEVVKYLEVYPEVFKDANSVIAREFITDLTFYSRYSFIARFREVYSLIRNREMKSLGEALKRAFDLMFRSELNPAIVAGLKSESQLDQLLECIEKNTLDDFKPFKIVFEFSPAKRQKLK